MPNVSRIAAVCIGTTAAAESVLCEPKQLVIVIDVAAVRVVARPSDASWDSLVFVGRPWEALAMVRLKVLEPLWI